MSSLPFFFFWLWRFEFPSLQLLPCGGVACVGGSLVPAKIFSFPRFLKRFPFKLLVFSLHAYFCKILAILCFSTPSLQLPLDFTTVISTLTSSPFQFLFNFPFLCFVPFLKSCFFCFFFMDHSGIRCTSPLVTFFFACLGAFIGCSSGLYRLIRDFTLGDNGLSLVLGELYPLLCESLSWFESVRGVLRREKMSSEGRSDDLGAILLSNAGVGEVETNTTISKPPSSRPSIPASPRPFHSF